jgi:hypothetical protein
MSSHVRRAALPLLAGSCCPTNHHALAWVSAGGERSLAGPTVNGEVAPIPAVRSRGVEWVKPTLRLPFLATRGGQAWRPETAIKHPLFCVIENSRLATTRSRS